LPTCDESCHHNRTNLWSLQQHRSHQTETFWQCIAAAWIGHRVIRNTAFECGAAFMLQHSDIHPIGPVRGKRMIAELVHWHRWATFALAMLAVTSLLLVLRASGTRAIDEPGIDNLRQAAIKIEPLHEKKRPPGPRDWLAQHKEAGQTFDQYLKSNPNRPTATRTRLYVQPLGEFTKRQQSLIGETAELMSRFYNLPVQTLDPLGLELIPPEAQRVHPQWGDYQILTTYVLDKLLKPRRPKDAVAMLALTASDLWPGDNWNFVFGQASLSERVGVWSIYRYGDPNDERPDNPFRRRLFNVALHETGHMFGMPHCTAYECCMNGSNHLAEMDSCPMWLCPQCMQKVCWACGADPASRYRELAEFATKYGLTKEAEFWQDSLKHLAASP
jgi:archaemetzincin